MAICAKGHKATWPSVSRSQHVLQHFIRNGREGGYPERTPSALHRAGETALVVLWGLDRDGGIHWSICYVICIVFGLKAIFGLNGSDPINLAPKKEWTKWFHRRLGDSLPSVLAKSHSSPSLCAHETYQNYPKQCLWSPQTRCFCCRIWGPEQVNAIRYTVIWNVDIYIFIVAHLSAFIMSSWIPEFDPGGETDWSTHHQHFLALGTGFYGLGHSESEGFRDVFAWKCHISIQLDILYHFVITGIIPSPLSVLKNCQVQALKMLKPLAHPRFAFVSLCLCVRWLWCLHHQHHRHHRHHGRHQMPMVAQCFARCRWMIL